MEKKINMSSVESFTVHALKNPRIIFRFVNGNEQEINMKTLQERHKKLFLDTLTEDDLQIEIDRRIKDKETFAETLSGPEKSRLLSEIHTEDFRLRLIPFAKSYIAEIEAKKRSAITLEKYIGDMIHAANNVVSIENVKGE